MSDNEINYDKEHYCPVYGKVVHPDLCYDSMMCLHRFFKVSSVEELSQVKDARCANIVNKITARRNACYFYTYFEKGEGYFD